VLSNVGNPSASLTIATVAQLQWGIGRSKGGTLRTECSFSGQVCRPMPISGLPAGGAGAVGRRRAAHGVALPAPGGEGSSAGSRPSTALICAGKGSRRNAWAKHLPSLAATIPKKPTARNIFDGLGVFQSADRCE